MLDQIKIAAPCSADWEQMEGDNRVRLCGECKKNIFNLSAMTRRDAEALLKTDGDICARLYRRADGTVLTEDCPVGLRVKVARVRRRLGWAISGALSLAIAWGQGSGLLSGRVTDIAGDAAPPTTITLVNSETGASAEAKTDADGKFKVTSLSKGIYTVKAVSPGFAPFSERDVRVHGRGERKLNITLTLPVIGTVVMIEHKKPWWRRLL